MTLKKIFIIILTITTLFDISYVISYYYNYFYKFVKLKRKS